MDTSSPSPLLCFVFAHRADGGGLTRAVRNVGHPRTTPRIKCMSTREPSVQPQEQAAQMRVQRHRCALLLQILQSCSEGMADRPEPIYPGDDLLRRLSDGWFPQTWALRPLDFERRAPLRSPRREARGSLREVRAKGGKDTFRSIECLCLNAWIESSCSEKCLYAACRRGGNSEATRKCAPIHAYQKIMAMHYALSLYCSQAIK